MAEETKSNEKKAKKRTNKLTNARIKKEIEFLTPMFAGIDAVSYTHLTLPTIA